MFGQWVSDSVVIGGGEVPADAMTEERRLAAFVAAVDDAGAVVPKGALMLDARHRVVINPSFKGQHYPPSMLSVAALQPIVSFLLLRQLLSHLRIVAGLSPEAAMDKGQFVHWRPPKRVDKKRAFETKGLTNPVDFLDPIEDDEPKATTEGMDGIVLTAD